MKLIDLKENCQHLTVLYVEDDKDVRASISYILKKIFKETFVAEDGKDGIECFKKNSRSIDIIITDIEMPYKDGITMSLEIREINNNIPIVVISAYNDSEYFLKMIKLGLDGYLIKPVEMDQFVNTLHKVIQKIVLKKENYQYQHHLEDEVYKKTKELEQKYYTDELTKIRNRYALLLDMKSNHIRDLILIDINKFSMLNDLYGSVAGDDILKLITQKLKTIISSTSTLYRVSADQFVVISDEKINNDNLLVQEINNSFCSSVFQITLDDELIDVNISVTISAVENVDSKNLLECADIAMHYAKQTNQSFVLYAQELTILLNHKKTIDAVKLVKNALLDDRLVPFFQPIVKKNSTTYECLVRVIDLNGDVVEPYMFVDEIKNTPYYIQLTKTMIDKSFEFFKDKKLSFSVNLSFEDISNNYIMNHIKSQLIKYNLNEYLILEILESETIDNFDVVKIFIKEMKELGVRIAIDDFGSGYSNFSYLLELEPDFIKIDGSIVKHIATNKKSYIIAKTIVEFSKELDIQTIAEYIHNKDVLDIVEKLGVDGRQGYYLGEPKPYIQC